MMNEIINMDFIVPIKQMGLFTRSVLEGIHLFYRPRRMIVIIRKDNIPILESESLNWKTKNIEIMDENLFFIKNFDLTMDQMREEFQKTGHEKHREFGWWYQQMIKLGASTQIENISEHYVVWDGDLIPLKKWDLSVANTEDGTIDYHIAILQNEARSDFNKQEYEKCIQHLLGFHSFSPLNEGTFVSHHMVFKVEYVKEMIEFILHKNKIVKSWPLYFISLSHSFYRFSEYMLYTSFMMHFHGNHFFYHTYEKYGKSGIRFREPEDIIQQISESYFCKQEQSEKKDFTYEEISNFFHTKSKHALPSYVQFEHVYYLL
jgi:hypothetical protein